ncbi:hypothetical protein F1880_008576 [Penicillium rolfsii]|nr:hypothetical protein F1880_008576 [Penicillium rolfsii]
MMHLLTTALLFFSFPLIHAQDGNVHTVDVGEDGLTFNPASLTAAPGDKVEFHFYPPEHNVVRASFANPCQPISSGGFFSGSFRTSGESKTVFTLTVNSTDPIWYYCGVQGHCQAGMVGVINPPSSGQDTLDSFKSAAANAQDSTVPANVFGGVVGDASSGNTSSATTSAATTRATSTAAGSSTGTSTSTSTSSSSKTSAATSTTTNAANTMRAAGDVAALMLLGLFSWVMM